MLKLLFTQSKGLSEGESKQKHTSQILPSTAHKYRDNSAFRCWFRFSVMVHNAIMPKSQYPFQQDTCNAKVALRAARAGNFRKALRIADNEVFLSCNKDNTYLHLSKLAASFGEATFAFLFTGRIQDIHAKDRACAETAAVFADLGKIAFALEATKSIFADELRMGTYDKIYIIACRMKSLNSQGTDAEAWKIALDMAHRGPIHHHQCAHEVTNLIKDARLRTDTLRIIESIQARANRKG